MEPDFYSAIGYDWTAKDFPPDVLTTKSHQKNVHFISEILSRTPSRSVLLMGESGVGKSTLISMVCQHLVRRRWTCVVAGANDLVAGQRYIGDLEKQVQTLVERLRSRDRVVWIVPRFHELYYTGRHEYSPTGILDQIMPLIDSGKIKLIGEVQPEHYEQILQKRPLLRTAVETVRVEPLSLEEAMHLTEGVCKKNCKKGTWVPLEPGILSEAAALSKQYLGLRAEPGNLIDFVRTTQKMVSSRKDRPEKLCIDDFINTLTDMTGLPKIVLDDQERLDTDQLIEKFRSKVIGQNEAVKVMVERIALIKAGLTDPTKPFGVFLFIGPTGTGKTELAKSVSGYLFGAEDKMIRLDMSEFQTYEAISRIVGSNSEINESTALTNMVRKNPFSVILLDEIEKAHPNIFDIFLQVFDDGRLTDLNGNTVDFRHTIIIMTSNLGSSVPSGPKIGFGGKEEVSSGDQVKKALYNAFRPEFLNRIDRIVNFKMLSQSTMRKILKKELQRVLELRGIKNRNWAVEWEESAIEFLMEKGFSAHFGARPMKRAIDDYLLSPLAISIVNHHFPEGDQFLFVRRGDNQLTVEFVDPDEPNVHWKTRKKMENELIERSKTLSLETIILDPKGNLAEREVLDREYADLLSRTLENGWADKKSELLSRMEMPGFWDDDKRWGILSEIEFRDRFEAAMDTAASIIDRLKEGQKVRLNYSAEVIRSLAVRTFILKKSIAAFKNEEAQDAYIRVRLEGNETNLHADEAIKFFENICQMYRRWAKKRKMTVFNLMAKAESDHQEWVAVIAGFAAYPLMKFESGLHVWEYPMTKRQTGRIRVKVQAAPQYTIKEDLKKELKAAKKALESVAVTDLKIVRKYRAEPSPLVRDHQANWRTGKLDKLFEGEFDVIGR